MPSSNFSKRASSYEANAHIQRSYASSLVNKSIEFLKSSTPKIADLGCGTGSICEEATKHFQSLTLENYDISEEMLNLTKQKFSQPGISFHLNSTPIGYDYDMIISNFALQWYENLPNVLNTCISRLKQGGIMAVCLPVSGSFDTLRLCFEKADAEGFFFKFPEQKSILESLRDTNILFQELREEDLIYGSTLDFFKNIHQIGANQTGKNLSKTKLRKLIHYHDELFDEKIIVKYKILNLIVKRVH